MSAGHKRPHSEAASAAAAVAVSLSAAAGATAAAARAMDIDSGSVTGGFGGGGGSSSDAKGPAAKRAKAEDAGAPTAPLTGEQACARALDDLWTSARVGLCVSVLNGLVAAFVAGPKPIAAVRELPLSVVAGHGLCGVVDACSARTAPKCSSLAHQPNRGHGMALSDDGGRLFAVTLSAVLLFETRNGAVTEVVPKVTAPSDWVLSPPIRRRPRRHGMGCVIDRATRSLVICDFYSHVLVRLRGVHV